jgi:hypothetical protein
MKTHRSGKNRFPTADPSEAAAALQLAHNFNDNGGTPTHVLDAPPPSGTPIVTVSVTPKVSGKFKLSASVVADNVAQTPAIHTIALSFGHAGVADYPIPPNPVDVPASGSAGASLDAESGSVLLPFVAPLNVSITFDLFAIADVAGAIDIPAHGAQLTVEELPN